jgi:hypothetical protein
MLEMNDENDESLRTVDLETEQGVYFFILFHKKFVFLFSSSNERAFQRNG